MKNNVLAWMIGVLALSVACTPKPPPQPPSNPCPAQCVAGSACTDGAVGCVQEPNHHLELLLRQRAGILTRGTVEGWKMRMYIPCWDPLEKDHGGWTGFSASCVDYANGYGENAFHLRLGAYVRDAPNVLWAGTGGLSADFGPCVNDDCAQGFEERWWTRALSMTHYAEERGANVQVSVWDGWLARHCLAGDAKCALTREELVAAVNHVTPFQRRWFEKVAQTFCAEGGVFYEDGNEVRITAADAGQQPYRPEWTFEMRNIIRQYEADHGCVVKMFGTNSENDTTEASTLIDYTSTHNTSIITSPSAGKWRLQNEHNPPFSPKAEQLAECAAANAGQAWAYWRGGHSQADRDATMALRKAGCQGVETGGCPFAVKPTAMLKCRSFGTHGTCDGRPCPAFDCTPADASGKPIWPEGDGELRLACEEKSRGGGIDFSVSPPLSIHQVIHSGSGFTVSGHGSSPVSCSIPKQPAGWKGCVASGTTNTFRVTIP